MPQKINPDGLIELREQKGAYSQKLESKLKIRYPFLALILVVSLYVTGFLISAIIGEVTAFLNSWMFIVGSPCLFIGVVTVLWFESSCLERILNIRRFLDVPDERYYEWVHYIIRQIYRPAFHILFSSPFLVLAIHSITLFYTSNSERFWPGISVELMNSCVFVAYLVVWCVIVSLIGGFAVYVSVVAGLRIAPKLSELPIIFNFLHPDGVFGLKPFVSYLLKLAALYFLDASIASAVFLTEPGLDTYIFVIVMSLPGFIGFFNVIHFMYKSLRTSKEELLKQISIFCDSYTRPKSLREKLKSPNGSNNHQALLTLMLFKEIHDKRAWPINVGIFTKAITLALSPTLTFALKMLVIYFNSGL